MHHNDVKQLINYLTPQEQSQLMSAIHGKELQIKSLRDFIKEAFPTIEPGTNYVHGWHIDAICEHLEAVTNGQIRNLIINMPPRHMKSLLVSVAWPCWEWIRNPHVKWIFASYGQQLSTRDSLKCRRLINSPWYQGRYGDIYQLTSDQNNKTRFDNDKLGYRLATSVRGIGTGEGGDRIVCLPYEMRIKVKYGNSLPIGEIVEHKLPCWVLSYDHKYTRSEYKRVSYYHKSTSNKLYEIWFETCKRIKCTPEHPIFVVGRGYLRADMICVNDQLMDMDDHCYAVTDVKVIDGEFDVYNIEVEGNNNYFVNNILVHNCDDPHNILEAESEAVRESTLIWWDEVMSSRFNDAKTGARVIVMQRSNARDLTGHCLEKGYYDHLCLPGEYEKRLYSTSIGFQDKRTEEGELLWPDKIGQPEMDMLKADLGNYAYAGQIQQRPAPREGGIIKFAWWKWYDLIKDHTNLIINPRFEYVIQSWDTAFKTGLNNDYSVCTTWGINQMGAYLVDLYRAKVDYPELLKMCVLLANEFCPSKIIIEDAASGQSLIQTLRKETKLPIIPLKVDRDKESYVHSISAFIESGRVFLPNEYSWVRTFTDEVCIFPSGAHDDIVDSMTKALVDIFLRVKARNIRNVSIMGR